MNRPSENLWMISASDTPLTSTSSITLNVNNYVYLLLSFYNRLLEYFKPTPANKLVCRSEHHPALFIRNSILLLKDLQSATKMLTSTISTPYYLHFVSFVLVKSTCSPPFPPNKFYMVIHDLLATYNGMWKGFLSMNQSVVKTCVLFST